MKQIVIAFVAFVLVLVPTSQGQGLNINPSDVNGDGYVGPEDLFQIVKNWSTGERHSTSLPLPGLPTGARRLKLVRVPAGKFWMGAPESEIGALAFERPVHRVQLDRDLFISETEITQAQWKSVMGSLPDYSGEKDFGVGDNYPVYQVSWEDCQDFIEKLNAMELGTFRLPSEAEWEYCCRAGTSTRFFFGDSLGCDDIGAECEAGSLPGVRSDYMWWVGTSDLFRGGPNFGVKPVAMKLPNPFGLYDMHGNVREWCQDWATGDYVSAPFDGSPGGTSASGLNSVRGGSWLTAATECRSAYRLGLAPQERTGDLGFRVIRLYGHGEEPTPTATPSNTPIEPTATPSSTATATFTVTPTVTATASSIPTSTQTPTASFTVTPTAPVPTATETGTSESPTASPTPTNTQEGPTETPVDPTATPSVTATATPVGPTATATSTSTPTVTVTSTPTQTSTPTTTPTEMQMDSDFRGSWNIQLDGAPIALTGGVFYVCPDSYRAVCPYVPFSALSVNLTVTRWECDIAIDGNISNGKIFSHITGGQVGTFTGKFTMTETGIGSSYAGNWAVNGNGTGTLRGLRITDTVDVPGVCE